MLTDKEILEPIRDWILTYPFTVPIGRIEIDYGQVDRSDRRGEGNALSLTSRLKITERKNTWGVITETWRVNFAVIIRRDANDNEIRREVSEFILRFIQWVNDENRKRGRAGENPLLPHFSDTKEETISADGGGATATLDGGRLEYQILLHADYQIVYK